MLITNLCMLILCFDVTCYSLIMKCHTYGLRNGALTGDPTIIIQ